MRWPISTFILQGRPHWSTWAKIPRLYTRPCQYCIVNAECLHCQKLIVECLHVNLALHGISAVLIASLACPALKLGWGLRPQEAPETRAQEWMRGGAPRCAAAYPPPPGSDRMAPAPQLPLLESFETAEEDMRNEASDNSSLKNHAHAHAHAHASADVCKDVACTLKH